MRAAVALPSSYYAGDALHVAAFTIAQRFRLPAAYDSHYLALAERLGIDFWTANQRLFNSVSPTLPWAKLVQGQITL